MTDFGPSRCYATAEAVVLRAGVDPVAAGTASIEDSAFALAGYLGEPDPDAAPGPDQRLCGAGGGTSSSSGSSAGSSNGAGSSGGSGASSSGGSGSGTTGTTGAGTGQPTTGTGTATTTTGAVTTICRCPARVTAAATCRRGSDDVSCRVSGRVRPLEGTPAPDECAGRVAVRIRRGGRTVASRTTRIRSSCRFASTLRIPRRRLGRARTVRVHVRFAGASFARPIRRVFTARIR